MPLEIERKFLVRSDAWRTRVTGRTRLDQAYLSAGPRGAVRIRVAGNRAWLTVKGPRTGASGREFEYPIPVEEAREMMARLPLQGRLQKIRHEVPDAGRIWVVDEFLAPHEGLVLAEIELGAESEQPDLPDWVGAEVTGDARYAGSSLARAGAGRRGAPRVNRPVRRPPGGPARPHRPRR